MKSNVKTVLYIALSLFGPYFAARAEVATPLNPADYPQIGDSEMGQLRWILGVADQPIGDYSNIESEDQFGMTAYRYNIAFSTYFLALEQYHKLPACPGIIQPRMDRYIQKIIQKPVWEYWAGVSQGIPLAEPYMNKPYPELHDPVAYQNIMYSAHVGHVIGLYEMLYRDFKWDKQGSIVFEWSADEKYVYDNHSLQKVMYDQMLNNPYHSIPCEPNMVFPECNQHPALSFILYDYTHGTHLADVNNQFFDFFLKRKMIDPETHQTAMYYLVKQDLVVSNENPRFKNAVDLLLVPMVSLKLIELEGPASNGWTGAFMAAWQPEYIQRHYTHQRDKHVVEKEPGMASFKFNVPDVLEPSLQYGFFAAYAAEMGDLKTRDALIAYADKIYPPVKQAGTLHYPAGKSSKCNSTTDRLLALARANSEKGLWKMHNQPFGDSHFAEPQVTGLDFPNVIPRRAIYDREKQVLILTLEPGDIKNVKTSFAVNNLNPAETYTLWIDGKETGKYAGQDSAEIKLTVAGRTDIILYAAR